MWFCLGEHNVPELSRAGNHKEYQGFELSHGVSVWETSPLFLPGTDLLLLLSCDASWMWFNLKRILVH